ncbi:MAG: hypothetical protein KME60_06530 [Cyanomargarita calcarea GSE-NOS-MK-12-04C]|uniref:Uncharacterized protein n=1 Tax=Cyanomargarita calcarea GSE-NOS-MK-12-04C TaxID=2839659 RepID=A0A951QK09_9CYAN|nr:hypothetical protein [Cyanomargarita calcarea GSE-NOS-MK-12-04C]
MQARNSFGYAIAYSNQPYLKRDRTSKLTLTKTAIAFPNKHLPKQRSHSPTNPNKIALPNQPSSQSAIALLNQP